jgi:signal transduction histidine kinase
LHCEDWYVASTYRGLAELHLASLDYESATPYAQRALELFRHCGDREESAYALITLGKLAQAAHNNDKAYDLYQQAEALLAANNSRHRMASLALSKIGEIDMQRGNVESVLFLLQAALERARRNESIIGQLQALCLLGTLYSTPGFAAFSPVQAEEFYAQAISIDANSMSPNIGLREALVAFYKQQKRYAEALDRVEELQQLQRASRDETLQRRIAQVEAKKQVEEARHLADIERQRNAELRAAQAKLVESEKMASLGQLTAGIEHEINNPVTFIASSIEPLRRDIEEYEAIRGEGPLAEELRTEIAALLAGIENGARRTAEIVRSLRIFSRLDEGAMKKSRPHRRYREYTHDSSLAPWRRHLDATRPFAPACRGVPPR